MICRVCGAAYCTCKNKTCPICVRAAQKNLVLVEYTGTQAERRIGNVVFSKTSPKTYVRPADLQMVLTDTDVKVVQQ